MFDSTPLKMQPPAGRNEFLHEVVLGRLADHRRAPSRRAPAGRLFAPAPAEKGRILDLIAQWDADVGALRASVNLAIDWVPFELAGATPAYFGGDGKRRVFCRFVYHGAAAAQAQHERRLRDAIAQITKWEAVAIDSGKTDQPK